MTHLGGARYVRVELASSLTLKMRVAILAHELQHACELARWGARTSNAVRALYQAIGRVADGRAERFDTGDAGRVGRLVWVELGESRARARTEDRWRRCGESRRASPESQHPMQRCRVSPRFTGWPGWQAP